MLTFLGIKVKLVTLTRPVNKDHTAKSKEVPSGRRNLPYRRFRLF